MSVVAFVPRLLAGARLGLAATAVVAPTQVGAAVGVREGDHEAAKPYVYALAGRELALGVGLLAARQTGHSGSRWLLAMAASDVFDAMVYEFLRQLQLLESEPATQARNTALGLASVYGVSGAVLR